MKRGWGTTECTGCYNAPEWVRISKAWLYWYKTLPHLEMGWSSCGIEMQAHKAALLRLYSDYRQLEQQGMTRAH